MIQNIPKFTSKILNCYKRILLPTSYLGCSEDIKEKQAHLTIFPKHKTQTLTHDTPSTGTRARTHTPEHRNTQSHTHTP